jgi:hypothetical protein
MAIQCILPTTQPEPTLSCTPYKTISASFLQTYAGPCELVLTLANLYIVLGLRDAIQSCTAATATATTTAADEATPATASGPLASASLQPCVTQPSASSPTASASAEGESSRRQRFTVDSHDALEDMQYMQSLHSFYSTKQTTGSTSSSTMDLEGTGLHGRPLTGFTGTGDSHISCNALDVPRFRGRGTFVFNTMQHPHPVGHHRVHEGAARAIHIGRSKQQYTMLTRMPPRALLRVHGSPVAPVAAPGHFL